MSDKSLKIQRVIFKSTATSVYYMFGLWCLTPLSKISRLYRGGQLYWWRKPEYLVKTTDLSQFTDNFYHIMFYRVQLSWVGFKLTTLVVIGTYKSNYHTTTIATSYNVTNEYIYLVSEWLLFNGKWEMFQLYQDENNLFFDGMTMMSVLN